MPPTDETALFRVQMGTNLLALYENGGDAAVLNRAIALLSSAAERLSGEVLSICLDRLGIALKLRARFASDRDDLLKAVEVHRRASEIIPRDSAPAGMVLDHYATALRAAYDTLGDVRRLNAAVRIGREALGLMPTGSHDWAIALGNLVNSIGRRADLSGHEADLTEALSLLDLADGQPLSADDRLFLSTVDFTLRLRALGSPQGLTAARAAWRKLDLRALGAPTTYNMAHNWCIGAFEAEAFDDVAEAFRVALPAAQELIHVAETTRAGKLGRQSELQQITDMAAYALARLGRAEEAVCEVEGASANLLRESALTGRTIAARLVEAGQDHLARRLEAVVRSKAYLSSEGASRFADLLAVREAFAQVMDEIAEVPGFTGLSARVDYGRLADTLRCAGGVAVYVVVTGKGAVALVAHGQGVDAIWSDSLDTDRVQGLNYGPGVTDAQLTAGVPIDRVGGWVGGQYQWRSALASSSGEAEATALDAWKASLAEVLETVAGDLGPRIAEHVRALGGRSVTLLPQSSIAAWPIAATGGPPGASLLELPATYAPSVALCAQLRGGATAGPERLLAVGDPANTGLRGLPAAVAEVEVIAAGFADPVKLCGSQATLESFCASCGEAAIWHFAGHASFDQAAPDQAALIFADGRHWPIHEIRSLAGQPPRLVVLSACDTGAFGLEAPSERQSLATAFLEIGASEVIASLWPVDDTASLIFMAALYERLDRADAAEALAQTQLWMRDTSDGEKRAWARARLAASSGLARDGWMTLYRGLALSADQDHEYTHPHLWSGYQVHGIGRSGL